MSITVKAADAAQFLSYLPRMMGCTPRESLVLVPLANGRSVGAMRFDLPPDDAVEGVASAAIGMLCRIADVDSFTAVVYTDAGIQRTPADAGASPPPDVAPRLPGGLLVDALRVRADACGLRIVDALTVAADGWGSHDDEALPRGGHPLGRLRLPAAEAGSLSAAGAVARGDQSSGAALPRVGQAARRAVAQAVSSLGTALETICGIPGVARTQTRVDPAALEAAGALDDLPDLFEEALGWPSPVAPMRAAMLGWCLERPALRDIALVQWATDQDGGDVAAEAQRRWQNGEAYPADLAEVMWGDGDRPDPDRLGTALTLVREVAALVPKAMRPGPLALCAWLSWALGRSTHAERYAAMALSIEHRHGLAEIVRTFVRAGHLPDWAFRPR